MAELLLPSAAPVPGARPAATESGARSASAHDEAGGAQDGASFQDALSEELGLALKGKAARGLVPDAGKADALDKAIEKSEEKPGAREPATENDPALALAAAGLPIPPLAPAPATVAHAPVFAAGGSERAVAPTARGDSAKLAAPAAGEPSQSKGPILAAAPGGEKLPPSAMEERPRLAGFEASLLEAHHAGPMHAPLAPADGAATQTAPLPTAQVSAPVGAHGWDQGVGDKLVWMASQKHQVAELRLNPPELGPMKVTLTLQDGTASAQFASAHAVVRDAIETALPRLREMLAESGITLGNASVSDFAYRGEAREQPQQDARGYGSGTAFVPDAGALAQGARVLRLAQGLVDTFA